MPEAEGHIDRAVDSLLSAVGDLDMIQIREAEALVDAAIARVLACSSTHLSKYVALLQKLKTDTGALHAGISTTAQEIDNANS
jgi:hypothetical protein